MALVFPVPCGQVLFMPRVISSIPEAYNDIPDAEARTLTVAFSSVHWHMLSDAYGNYKDLWSIISMKSQKYNNWDYEYVSVDPDFLLDEFLAGKYDILGVSLSERL